MHRRRNSWGAATLSCRDPLAHTDGRLTPAKVWIETSGMAADRDAWTSRRAEESGMLLRVKYERLWERLIESLNNWTSASETGAGQIEVALPDNSVPARHVVIVMTPDEWDQMVTVMWGNFDGAFQDVKRTLLTMQPDEHFAVYADYRLESSTEPTLPEPPDITPEPGGEWVAYDREGRIESRFADWSDPNEPR